MLAHTANASGKIVGSLTALRYSVRLDDGTQLEAILPTEVLHRIGCLFRPLPDGSEVIVSLRDPPKQHRIVRVTFAQ